MAADNLVIQGARASAVMVCTELFWQAMLTHLPGQNDRHFADNIFKCIFMNEKFWILFKSSLKFVPKGPIDNNSALV